MLKSQIKKKILAVLTDHLEGTFDEDDILVIANDIVDELNHNTDLEDDDEVFKGNDLGFYESEELND